jgi:hypothetical protein
LSNHQTPSSKMVVRVRLQRMLKFWSKFSRRLIDGSFLSSIIPNLVTNTFVTPLSRIRAPLVANPW